MLREKETYRFTVLRRITLPDESAHWVLTLDGADRYLLPLEFYGGYNISEGQQMLCRVDKINCSGKIYLEPEHPGYREGERYLFHFSGVELITDCAGNSLQRLLLRGIHNDVHEMLVIPGSSFWQSGDGIQVVVRRIKKGRLLLDFHDDADQPVISEGGRYLFRIGDYAGSGQFHVTGPGDLRSMIEVDLYPSYGLESGVEFYGYLVKWDPEGIPVIEPNHPLYRPGGIYPFRVLRTEAAEGGAGSWMRVLIVSDCFGGEIKVTQAKPSVSGAPVPEEVQCRVERMKRGRPVIRIADE